VKIAIVYNRDSQNVINLFGIPNRERIGLKTIKRVSEALRAGKHQVKTIEGDKDLVDRLEEFMPRVVKGERPGLVFNVSYGIQGQSRYAHVPSILEMVGIPYVGSGPLAHGLALDKVMAKIIFRQHGLPTPDYVVLNPWECDKAPELPYPLVVKPKHEAVSFGLKIVHNEQELRQAVGDIFEIYTYEDKVHKSGREIHFECPARLSQDLSTKAQVLAQKAFESLGCYDCARVDMRIDNNGNIYVLEVNSLPSLGEHGSYTIGAQHAGLDFSALVIRLVEVASARYFGTPKPMVLRDDRADLGSLALSFLTERRDQIERRLRFWTNIHSRTSDSLGIREAARRLGEGLADIGLRQLTQFTDELSTWAWETKAGLANGTLFVGHLDVPVGPQVPVQEFRRDPEWLHGEGIGLSRAPLVMLEFVLRALKSLRRLRRLGLGVLYYADEGQDCIHSAETIRKAAAQAKRVLILRPGNLDNKVVTQHRGQRKYRLRVEGVPVRLGKAGKKPQMLSWLFTKLQALSELSSLEDRTAVAATEIKTTTFPMLLPHLVTVTLLVSYGDEQVADKLEGKMRDILAKDGFNCELEPISDRPPMQNRRENRQLVKELAEVATQWEIPFDRESSHWPSVAGLVPAPVGVICGVGPVAKNLYRPQEAVQRISVLQRALLLAEFLVRQLEG
jgi:D-alanine-D-alanine ligase